MGAEYEVAKTWHVKVMPTTVSTRPGRHFPWHRGRYLSFEKDEIRTTKLAIILQDMPGHEV